MKDTCAVILAAGDGKRMQSDKPKVLCEVLLKPMILWVIDHVKQAGITDICVVVGKGSDQVIAVLPEDVQTVLQTERKGTGHAVMMCEAYLRERIGKDVLILCGDAPFVDADTITNAYARFRETQAQAAVITAELEHPTGYGRILRGADDRLCRIVEEKDASDAERKIREVNAGSYWVKIPYLLEALGQLQNNNASGEYYLTDIITDRVKTIACRAADPSVSCGANDRKALHRLNEIARAQVLDRLFAQGVDIPLTDGVLITPEVQIGRDTTILPGCILTGRTVIGSGCTIGPNSMIADSEIGDGCIVEATKITGSRLERQVKIGPFSQVRPGCVIRSGVKIGDFVEIKNSVIDEETKVAHLTYVGDSDVGKRVNFGCGCVTVNYDGCKKYRTEIGDGAFIGCNTNLVAPVKVGNGAYTAAGTTVNKDVPDGALAIGRIKQENKDNWAKRKLRQKKEQGCF